jgi:adenosine deaminase
MQRIPQYLMSAPQKYALHRLERYLHAVYISIHVFLCLHQAWPEDALEMVANKFLDDVEMSYNVRKEVVFMCKYFHESVRALSEK